MDSADASLSNKRSVSDKGFATTGNEDGPRASGLVKFRASVYSSTVEAIQAEQEDSAAKIERYRVTCKKFMHDSTFGTWYQIANLTISSVSALQFIYLTYLNHDNEHDKLRLEQATKMSIALVCFFAWDWLLNLFLADNKVTHFLSFYSLVDVITVVCTILTRAQNPPILRRASPVQDIVMYIVYACSNVRILRALKLGKESVIFEDAVARYLAEISLNVIVFLLFFAALVEFLERETYSYEFHTWIYYVWVTLSTVGYGDITPHTVAGRTAAMVMIGFAVISVPKVTNELIEKMSLQSVYMRATYVPKSRSSKHVLICGDLASTSLRNFFEELFHEDHENTDLSAVILLPNPPTVETILLMREPQYLFSSVFLEGSALVESDLKRAKAETARAIFIMSNKFSANPDEEDAKSILLNLSIKRYLSSRLRQDMLYCTQLIRPENRRHLSKNDANELDENDLVVCLNEIKMGAMAKAVVCPGANTLIMNLVTSFSDSGLSGDDDDSYSQSHNGVQRRSANWIKEYEMGCGWEIYTTTLSSVFSDANFCELSYALFEKIGVVLFALEITDLKNEGQSRLVLNPAEYIIPSQEEFSIKAFVIAKNQASSDLSFHGESLEFDDGSPLRKLNRNLTTFMSTQARTTLSTVGTVVKDRRMSILKATGLGKHKSSGTSAAPDITTTKRSNSKWATLKRSTAEATQLQAQSYQEVLTHLEDDHFSKNYYACRIPAELNTVTVKNAVFEEVPFINQHLIILGKGLRNLYDFIRPLRAKYLPMHYIVLIYPDEIPHDVWQRISIFEAILVVRGSPLEESTLRRAGIFRAAQVVVMADGSQKSTTLGMEALADSDAIFAYQLVKRMNPNAQMLVEIVNQSNIAYIHDDHYDEDMDNRANAPRFAPSFAAGNLFTTSFLDSIVCQSYYNPLIIKVINELISGVDQAERTDLMADAADIVADDIHAIEESLSKSDIMRPVVSSKVKKKVVNMQQKGRSRVTSIKGSYLYQIPLPDLEAGARTYGALYQHLSKQGMLPLGILRGTFNSLTVGPKGNKMPYVFANPSKDCELYSCDRIFVLSPKPVGVNPHQGVMDVVTDLQAQRSRLGSSSSDNIPMPRLVRSRPNSGGGKSRPGSGKSRHGDSTPEELGKMLSNIVAMMEQTMSPTNTVAGPPSAFGTPASNRGRKSFHSQSTPSTPLQPTVEQPLSAGTEAVKPSMMKVLNAFQR